MSKFARGGGQSCAVVGCSNNRKKIYLWKKTTCDLHAVIHEDCPCCLPYILHKLPTRNEENRQKWLASLKRKELPNDVFVCSVHFVEGRPTERNPYPVLHLGYDAPVRTGRRLLKRKERDVAMVTKRRVVERHEHSGSTGPATCTKQQLEPSSITSDSSEPMNNTTTSSTTGTQWTDMSLEDHSYSSITTINPQSFPSYSTSCPSTETPLKMFAEKGVNCRTSHITMSASTLNTDSLSNLYTGLNLTAFNTLVNVIENSPIPFKFTMPVADQVLLTLMKLKLNLLFADLAHRFGISESHASNIFNSWLPFLATTLKDLIVWLPRETIRAAMPPSFQEKYPHTTVIIDCAETFLQMPKNLKTRGETYSHYKSHNTVKYLVGIAPHGQIMFISKSFGGRASDKFIVENSGFLNFLLPGDEVMADRGFTISNNLFPLRVKLNIPAFTHGKKQLSDKDVTETRRIAHVRIHVERAIRRLKVFKILSDIVPISCARKVDDILIVCAALVNLGPPLIKDIEE